MTAQRKAFILTPFRPPFDHHYSMVIRPALEECGFTVFRADDIYTPRPVILDIQESILTSDLILCEMTGRSPNVFYELGLAHAVGKPAILVSTTEEDIPFDLQHVRVIHYETHAEGWEGKLREAIQKAAVAAMTPGNVWPPPLALSSMSGQFPGSKAKTQPLNDYEHDPRIVDRPINLGFDGAMEKGFPHGWFDSIGHVSSVSSDYAVRVIDRDDLPSGKCLMMFKKDAAFGRVRVRDAAFSRRIHLRSGHPARGRDSNKGRKRVGWLLAPGRCRRHAQCLFRQYERPQSNGHDQLDSIYHRGPAAQGIGMAQHRSGL